MKKFLKVCGWIALSIVLLLGLVLALSPVVKYVINNYGERIVGRQLHAEHVVVNPYWGGVTIRDFSCTEANGETDFVSFDRLYVQIAWPQLAAKRVVLRHIHLDGFSGQVLKNGERVNFSDIIERYDKDSTDQPRDTTPSSWIVQLKDIRIHNSTIRYRDVLTDKQWSLDDMSLHVPGLYFDNTQTNAGLEFALPTGGRVGILAGMKMEASRYAVQLNLYDVHADVVLPLVQDYLDVSGLGARLNGSIHADGSLDNITNIMLDGSLSLAGLNLRDSHGDEVAALDEMRVVIAKGDVAQNTYLLDTLTLTGLTGNYEVHEGWNTLTRLTKVHEPEEASDDEAVADSAAAPQPEKKAAKPIVWMAKVVNLTGENLRYSDYSMKNDWGYTVQSLNVDGRNVASNGRNQVKVKAVLQKGGKLTADYVGSLDLKRDDSRLNLKMTGVDITDFSALCRNYTGYPLESGILSMESQLQVMSGRLEGNNHIVIDKPKVGKKERMSKAPHRNIPVRLGFNLLTSAQNMIVLDVPVAGDVTNPKFKLNKVIGRAILKVFFGPIMGANDRNKAITDDELREMQELLGDDSVSDVAADVAMAAGDSLSITKVGQ